MPYRIGRRPLRKLRRAHDQMARGEYERAGAAFERLALRAEQRGFPQAARLYLQAGRAWARSGEAERGLDRLRHAFRILLRSGRQSRIPVILERVTAELRELGYDLQAESLRNELDLDLQEMEADPQIGSEPAGHLPGKCPYCGGTVRPDEVQWISVEHAVCDYCGSTLAADE